MMCLTIVQTTVSQTVNLTFTGVSNVGTYVRLDSVVVYDTNRLWTETVVYPDTVLLLKYMPAGINETERFIEDVAIFPNPFNGATNLSFALSHLGSVSMQVSTLSGHKVVERTMILSEGINKFEVRLKRKQVYLLTLSTSQWSKTIKLINSGVASENNIIHINNGTVVEKRMSSYALRLGDVLRIVGYTTVDGVTLASRKIVQPQLGSENFTLFFITVPYDTAFSTSDSTKVFFSPGNLQWSATGGGNAFTTHIVEGDSPKEGTWRFAPHQWDTIGSANANASSTYSGWIDLFGWGTSGWNNGNLYYQPYSTAYVNSGTIGFGYGPTDGTLYAYDLFGTFAKADWGVYNAIYNPHTSTTDPPGTWRTPTRLEWDYILFQRSTLFGIRFAEGTVNGVCGLIIVPDNWDTAIYTLNNVNSINYYSSYTDNVISLANWSVLENSGCVFLPAAGSRREGASSISEVNEYGFYWASTHKVDPYRTDSYHTGCCADILMFYYRVSLYAFIRDMGISVRLVRDVQ